MTEKEKRKIPNLTCGSYQPREKLKQLADGTILRLEDPTTPMTQEEIAKEKQEKSELEV